MVEQVISDELEKLIREKGFKREHELILVHGSILTNIPIYSSLVQKWLRDIHKIDCFAIRINRQYACDIYTTKGWEFRSKDYSTYEEALEAGLFEAMNYII